MPDIPIDTLFIVGLLIASFIGKWMENKAKKNKNFPANEKQTTKKDDGEQSEQKTLSDLLRETFVDVLEPEPVPSQNKSLKNAKDFADPVLPKRSKLTSPHFESHSKQEMADCNQIDDFKVELVSTRHWLKHYALGSKRSLRRAFIVKEVLDQPRGLRGSIF